MLEIVELFLTFGYWFIIEAVAFCGDEIVKMYSL